MAIREYSLPTINLADARFEQPLNVDMEAFFAFSFDVSEGLLDLEAQYANFAPAAQQQHLATSSS